MSRARAADEDQFARIAPYYDALMANVPYGLWASYISQLALLADRPIWPRSKLLDLATGTGSVAIHFAQRGCDVTGIDLSAAMIDEAKRKAAEEEVDVVFLCRDLADFDLPPEFDHAVCLYDSLNYMLDPDKLKQAFANTRRALQPGGVLIFDVNTVRALEEELFTQDNRPGTDVEYHWVSKYDRKTRISRVKMEFRIPSTDKEFTIIHRQRAYTDAEIRSYLAHAGFAPVSAHDAYRVTPPSPDSDRVFYVATAAGEGAR